VMLPRYTIENEFVLAGTVSRGTTMHRKQSPWAFSILPKELERESAQSGTGVIDLDSMQVKAADRACGRIERRQQHMTKS
jgi:hypothetical protein